MHFDDISRHGLVLLGCGKMGSAMLAGWLRDGLDPKAVWVIDPQPSGWLLEQGVHINQSLPPQPAVILVAVKPQLMEQALPQIEAFGDAPETVILSVAAGTPIKAYESMLGTQTPVIRAMPNTPAAIGKGITAISANSHVSEGQLQVADQLLKAIGQTVRCEAEAQLDAVTGVSGSGPAYVFYMIDALAAAGRAQGLSCAMAMQLAKATVAGAGALAETSDETPEQLRVNVTSPNGTTQAGLEVLMNEGSGLGPLMEKTVAAAADRSRELANG